MIRYMIRSIPVAAVTLAALRALVPAGAQSPPSPAEAPDPEIGSDRQGRHRAHRRSRSKMQALLPSVPIFRAPDLGYTGNVSADAVLDAVRNHAPHRRRHRRRARHRRYAREPDDPGQGRRRRNRPRSVRAIRSRPSKDIAITFATRHARDVCGAFLARRRYGSRRWNMTRAAGVSRRRSKLLQAQASDR